MTKDPVKRNDLREEIADLKKENDELKAKNHELEETLEAIRSGEVDAIIVSKGDGQQIYTLEGADKPYQVLVENIKEGALTLSRAGLILYANTRFAEMVKKPADKVVGTFIVDHICPEYRTEMEVALQQIMKKACRSWVRIRQEKGSLPVMISMNPLDHGDDSKISVILTDRRKDEDRIMLQARMLDSVGDAVIAANTHNKIIYWNDAATKTYGWTPDEALGRDLIETATPKMSHKDAKDIAERLKKGETWTGEYVVKHRDGHEFPIYANDAPIFDDDGKLIAIIGASHDITERKIAEKALFESELRFRSLAENTPSVLQRFDRQLRVVYLSPLAAEITGIPLESFIGKTNREIGMPEDLCNLWEKAQKEVFETGQNRDVEFDIATPDGKRTFLLRFAPEKAVDGSVSYILGISTDITERKRTEDELKQKHEDLNAAIEEITATQEELRQNVEELMNREEELNDALAEKEILLSEIHHRVKNNLTAFISLLSLEGSYVETPEGQALKKIFQNRARTMALIHETLYKTRQYSEVDMEVYLSTLVNQVVNSYSSTRSISTFVNAQGVTLDLTRATPIGLIINELVTNSLKYAFPRDTITCQADRKEPCAIRIRLTKEDGTYLMSISDNGVGLPKGLDIRTTKSLGLKLVNFLASHQLRAKLEINTVNGTEFVFRFKERDRG